MLRLAAARPLEEWTKPAATGEAFFASEAGRWSLQGVRPANHPRLRLRQYADWVRERPDWPARLLALADALPAPRWERTTAAVRRLGQFTKLRTAMAAGVGATTVGGTRLDNLVCDGFLPLLAAASGRDLGGVWFHWYPGDLPVVLPKSLRGLGVIDGRVHPASHGVAQGLLGWLLEREARD